MTFAALETPPVGSGNYASWVVFVFVILLAVILAEWVISAAGLKRR